tara:strand:- start:39 stop:371 length:333 start_codon:yes stop_codon:yes gene_type:complete
MLKQKRMSTPETGHGRKPVPSTVEAAQILNQDLPLEMRGTKKGATPTGNSKPQQIKHKLLQNSFLHQTPLNFLPKKKSDAKKVFNHDKLLYIEQIQKELDKYKQLQRKLS